MSVDLTPSFNEELKRHNAPSTINESYTLQNIDEFLKEAYRINSHISSLTTYLRGIRKSYLSTALAPRRLISRSNDKAQYLSDRQRDEIDAETKQLLRELNASIRNLADAEQLRQNTELVKSRQKYGAGRFNALSSWAAGGAATTKSYEQEEEEARANTFNMHRESVLWYLRQRLQECGMLQASMMEIRMERVVEKNKSVLSKARGQAIPDFVAPSTPVKHSASRVARMEDSQELNVEEQFSPEQLQMFEKENQDMLKHYEATLDQVRTAEKSLVEISELQTQLVSNLETQSAHIEQLVADSINTQENVGGGNKQLKKATERESTAKWVFYASCGLCTTLIIWDLLI